MDEPIYYFGRYGERLATRKHAEDQYVVTSEEANLNLCLSKTGFEALIDRYVNRGEPVFDKENLPMKKARAINMSRLLLRYYRMFQGNLSMAKKSLLECFWYASDIYRMMLDARVLELTDEQYESWFVRGGWDDTNEETEEYVRFILEAKKHVIDKHHN